MKTKYIELLNKIEEEKLAGLHLDGFDKLPCVWRKYALEKVQSWYDANLISENDFHKICKYEVSQFVKEMDEKRRMMLLCGE